MIELAQKLNEPKSEYELKVLLDILYIQSKRKRENEGRKLYRKRTDKRPLLIRADELLSHNLSLVIAKGTSNPIYNFEYFLNRAYCFNRDRGKCKVCGEQVESHNVEIHHINPKLPLEQVNKVAQLATMHVNCHKVIHNNAGYSDRGNKVWKKILKFREMLKG